MGVCAYEIYKDIEILVEGQKNDAEILYSSSCFVGQKQKFSASEISTSSCCGF